MNGILLHWFDGSAYNGQPMDSKTKTLCGKVEKENIGGDELVRFGADHPYQISCPDCKFVMDQRNKLISENKS